MKEAKKPRFLEVPPKPLPVVVVSGNFPSKISHKIFAGALLLIIGLSIWLIIANLCN